MKSSAYDALIIDFAMKAERNKAAAYARPLMYYRVGVQGKRRGKGSGDRRGLVMVIYFDIQFTL